MGFNPTVLTMVCGGFLEALPQYPFGPPRSIPLPMKIVGMLWADITQERIL